jgi:hypothetical protein
VTGDYTEPATAITFTFNFSADGEYISADVSCPHESTGCGGLGPLDDLCSAASYNREDCNFGCTRSLIRPFLRMLDADLLRELQS